MITYTKKIEALGISLNLKKLLQKVKTLAIMGHILIFACTITTGNLLKTRRDAQS